MRTRILTACFVLSLLLNLTAIPLLAWRLARYDLMYRRNVDYVAEFAYAVGYHKALGSDLAKELESYPRLGSPVTEAEADSVEVVIWPAAGQRLRLEFTNPRVAKAHIIEGAGPPNRP